MDTGLSKKHLDMIVKTLKEADVSRALLYGSRAKGNWKHNSDIDIAVFGSNVNIGNLFDKLDELPMPYKFDVTDYDLINNVALKEHIDRVGVELLEM